MLWTELGIATMREFPADVPSPGERWLMRAGYLRRDRSWTPLGERALARVESLDDPLAEAALEHICGVALSEPGDERVAVYGNYAELVDRAVTDPAPPSIPDPEDRDGPEPFHTPGQKTIADIARFTGLPETSQMKSVVVVCAGEVVLALVRGDHKLSDFKLARYTGARDVRGATPEEIRERFGASAGSLGPVGLANVRVIADDALSGRKNMICGANRDDYHLRNVTPGRDFASEFASIRQAADDDPGVQIRKGLMLDTPARILVAAAGQQNDAEGLVLHPAIAPFDVVITPVFIKDETQRAAAERLLERTPRALLDNRDTSPGIKFKDADLIGIPRRITIGRKVAQGLAESVDRKTKQVTEISL
jgi:prolyl-tRNA synthetase